MTEPAMYFTNFYCRQFFKRAIYSFVLDLSSFLKSFKNMLHTTQKYAKFEPCNTVLCLSNCGILAFCFGRFS